MGQKGKKDEQTFAARICQPASGRQEKVVVDSPHVLPKLTI